jgi:hypothetical protein
MRKYRHLLIAIAIIPMLSGCWWDVTPRIETVVDVSYIPQECPTFPYVLKIKGEKYKAGREYNQTMVITALSPFIESLERNKLARETFNKAILESNKVLTVPGIPETSNFVRVQKRIFVERECPKYTFKPQIKARKLTPRFIADNNTTYVVIPLDNIVLSMERHKLSKKTYNEHVESINKLPFTEAMKLKFNGYMKISVDKINDTADAIKAKAVDYSKGKVKEAVIGN